MLSLANSALGVASSPAHRFRSAVEMSQMAPFTDAARANDPTNFGYSFINYYPYGSAIALALDLSLRAALERQGDARRLHARRCGGCTASRRRRPATSQRPYTLEDARDAARRGLGDRAFADDFFSRYIEGREVPDYAKLLAARGRHGRGRAARTPGPARRSTPRDRSRRCAA